MAHRRWLHALLLLLLALLLVLLIAMAARADDLPERQRVLDLLAQGKPAEALAAAQEWTKAHPDLPDALLLLATMQEANDDLPGALDSLESAYFLTRDVSILVRKGRVYLESGQFPLAERQFQEALRQHESHVPAHVGLAQVMMEKGQLTEAGAALQAALGIDPHSVEALVAMARLQMAAGKPLEARPRLEQALQADAKAAEARLLLGQLAAESGDMAQARLHWQSYVTTDPGSVMSWQLAHNLYPIRSRPFDCTGYYPTFAHDGKRFAFRGRGDAGAVYLSTVDNPAVFERIYMGPGTIYSLDWSPDDTRLLCRDYKQDTVDGKPQFTYRLLVIEGKAGGAARVLYEGRYVGVPSWLQDGQSVLFDGYVPGKGRPLLRLPLTGGEPQPALLPERDESFAGCATLPTEPMPADGSLPRLLVHRWSVPAREYQVVLVNPKNRAQDQVLARSAQSLNYSAVSPDGRYLLYYRRAGQPPTWSLVALPLQEGGPGRQLPFRTAMPMPPALTPDMRHLVLYDRQGLQMVDLVGVKDGGAGY